tara:strand:+ start:3598 stop:6030 length:2433 start_codon:yes stop_codon:yes gene_type:complete
LGNAFTISTTLPGDLQSASSVFSKYVEVFGLRILATSGVSDAKVLHTANVLAEYLDNDENGVIDQAEVLSKLAGTSNSTISTMVLFASEAEQNSHGSSFESLQTIMSRTQNLFADEIFENGSQGTNRDATLEEVLHLVTDKGWDEAFPSIWGEKKGSSIADAMDTARGGYFETIPSSYPTGAWYTYYDLSSDYATQVTEYVYWATTTYLGGQDWSGRVHSNFASEWKPITQADLNSTDPIVVSLLTSSSYKFPITQLPDGNYSVSSVRARASLTNANGWKNSSWLGYFYDPGSNWIHHQFLGWLYPVDSGSNGVWFYHSSYGWTWTDSTAYPWVYFYSLSGWRYFLSGKGFYEADTGAWTALESFSVETSGGTNNDNSSSQLPAFQSDGNLSILENQTFVFEFNVTDPDGDALTYSLPYGDDLLLFELNASTGSLSFLMPKDFESPEDNDSDNRYEATIQVSDGKNSVSLNLIVQVTDVVESVPNQTGYGDENSSTVWSSTANASVSLSHSTSNGNSVITLTSNLYPNWNITGESGHYATTPSVQSESVEIILHPDSTASFHNELVVYNPTFSDVAYIGRPNNSLPDYTHWDSSTPPKELLAVDMLSVEAYDMTSAHGANPRYTGKLRFNVHYIGDNGLTGVTWQSGTIPLSNDYFYAHTQPTGEYHLHGFKAGMEFDYSNKIIGYALDGHAIMGMNTKIHQPVMDGGNVLSGYDPSAQTKPALSGYALVETGKLIEARGVDLSTTNFPAGIFHVDHEYAPTVASDSYSLDKYNMGYVTLTDKDGTQRVEKAYVQTRTYPYLLHTLYGAK